MTTTEQYQKKPNWFSTIEESQQNKKNTINTNPRYAFFKQTQYTAGDREQFFQYYNPTNGEDRSKMPNLDDNIFVSESLNFEKRVEWEKYRDLQPDAIDNTFNYIFNKFKKGIFIKIKDGKLDVFLPFSKVDFKNEWSHLIRIDTMPSVKFKVNDNPEKWFGNNHLIRCEYPMQEYDGGIPVLKDMFLELCESRQIPDLEFFVNKRDCPIIKKNSTEAYEALFGRDVPLVSCNFEKYSPILGMCSSREFADIPMPTHDDWVLIRERECKYFKSRNYSSTVPNFNKDWSSKIPTAVFRGTATGAGITTSTNARLRVAELSSLEKRDTDNILFLDAGITSWNKRVRKIRDNSDLQLIDPSDFSFNLCSFMSPVEQSNYKYIIHIDGHVSAFRLSRELTMGSVLLVVESEYKTWLSDFLEPWTHYVPVRGDLSDLFDKIRWCKSNDVECQRMITECLKLADKMVTKEGILDYLQMLLVSVKKQSGDYRFFKSLRELQMESELGYIKESRIDINLTNEFKLRSFPSYPALSSEFLKGVQLSLEPFLNEFECTEEVLRKTSNVTIYKSVFNDYEICIKESLTVFKHIENIHEAFIGLAVVNYIRTFIPNVVFTFGLQENNNLLIEYVPGDTLHQYLLSPDFKLDEYFNILLQVILTLHMLQQNNAFVHNDLYPWNIILKRVDKPVKIDYIINSSKVVQIETMVIPVIIDFGKSHCVYKEMFYSNMNMFRTSTVQDILSILISSIFIIISKQQLKKRVEYNEFEEIIVLSNFLGGTKYTNYSYFNNVSKIKNFFRVAKTYTNMTESPKYELESKTPLGLFMYILKRSRMNFDYIRLKTSFKPRYNLGSAIHVVDHVYSLNSEESLVRELEEKFRRYNSNCILHRSYYKFMNYSKIKFLDENFCEDVLILGDSYKLTEVVKVNIDLSEEIFKNLYSLGKLERDVCDIKVYPNKYMVFMISLHSSNLPTKVADEFRKQVKYENNVLNLVNAAIVKTSKYYLEKIHD